MCADDCPIKEFLLKECPEDQKPWRNIKLVRDRKRSSKHCVSDNRPKSEQEYAENWQLVDGTQDGFFGDRWTDVQIAASQDEKAKMSDVRFCRSKSPALDTACKDNGILLENHLSIRFQYVPTMLVVDDDDKDPVRSAACKKLFHDCPFTKTGKGTHYFLKVEGMPSFSNEINVFQDFCGDLLGHDDSKCRNVWEEENRTVFNGKLPVPVRTFGEIKSLFNKRFWKGVKDKTRVPEEFAVKVTKPVSKMSKKEKTQTKLTKAAGDMPRKIPTADEWNKLMDLGDGDCEYETWVRVGFATKGFGDSFFPLFDEWSATCGDSPVNCTQGYPGTEALREIWDSWERSAGEPTLGWSGLRKLVGEEWGGEAYEAFSHDEGMEFVKRIKYYTKHAGDCQVAECFLAFVGEVADGTNESDYIATEGAGTLGTSYIKYTRNSGYWKPHEHGVALITRDCVNKILPYIEGQMNKLLLSCPELAEPEPEAGWADTPQGKGAIMMEKRMKQLHATFSTESTYPKIAKFIHSLSYDNDRATKIDSNSPSVDGNRYKFALNNLVVDLLTGDMRKARREENLSTTCGYDLNMDLLDEDNEPTDECNRIWEEEIMQYFATLLTTRVPAREGDPEPDPDVPKALAVELARACFSYNQYEKIVMLTGGGGNGKSQFVKWIKRVFGNFGGVLRAEYWTSSGNSEDKPDNSLTNCAFKKFVYSAEVPAEKARASGKVDRVWFNEALFKMLIGGDEIPMRYMYQEQFLKELECSFFMAFNKCPAFDGSAASMQRRIDLFHFQFTFDTSLSHMPNFSQGTKDINAKLASNLWRDVCCIQLLKICTRVHVDPATKMPYEKQPYTHPKSLLLLKKNMLRDNQDHFADFVEWAFSDPAKSEAGWSETFEAVLKAYKDYCGPVSAGSGYGGYSGDNYIKKWMWLDTDPLKGFRTQGFYTKMGGIFTVDKKRKLFVGCRMIPTADRQPRDEPAEEEHFSDSD